jgi:hypothetical protein
MFSAWRGQGFRRDLYEPLVTVAHAPSNLPISVLETIFIRTQLREQTNYECSSVTAMTVLLETINLKRV